MSQTLLDLKKLFTQSEPQRVGTVIEVRLTSIVVKSPVGLKELLVVSPASYEVGDLVRFQGDVFIGKLPSDTNLPRYPV